MSVYGPPLLQLVPPLSPLVLNFDFDADPGHAFYFDADPDIDPDPASQNDADSMRMRIRKIASKTKHLDFCTVFYIIVPLTSACSTCQREKV